MTTTPYPKPWLDQEASSGAQKWMTKFGGWDNQDSPQQWTVLKRPLKAISLKPDLTQAAGSKSWPPVYIRWTESWACSS